MKTKNAIGSYNPDGTKKVKRTLKRKMKFNKTYKGTLTLRNKRLREKRILAYMAIGFILIALNAFADISNDYSINGVVAKGIRPASELDACVEQDSEVEKLKAPASLPVMVETKPTVEDVKKEIIKQSREFGLNENMMLALADCESDFIWNAKNPTSTARGVFQYLIGTWEETESAKQGFERNNIEANIREAMIDVSNGESWRWRDCGYDLRAMGYNF